MQSLKEIVIDIGCPLCRETSERYDSLQRANEQLGQMLDALLCQLQRQAQENHALTIMVDIQAQKIQKYYNLETLLKSSNLQIAA